MTKKEAYQILGLEEGASKEEILANYQKTDEEKSPRFGGFRLDYKKIK